MDELMAARYWCYQCDQMISPMIMEVEIKCPHCLGGFVEEMSNDGARDSNTRSDSDRALSLWAPILLGMMGGNARRRRHRRIEFEDEDGENGENGENSDGEARRGVDTDLDRELESIIRSRRRSSATILQLLQGIRDGMASENENSENDRERERVILVDPFNQTIIVQGSQTRNSNHIGYIGDYLSGPGLDLLLQHLEENDPNRHGTPPARKEAIEAMPTVRIKENSQCSVCLDDFEVGSEAKAMACKHKFHSGCILPWLELHSSCPVCRYQMPADEPKLDPGRPMSSNDNSNRRESESDVHHGEEEGEVDGRSGSRFSFPWPFNGLFTSGSQSGRANSSSSASRSGNAYQTDEN